MLVRMRSPEDFETETLEKGHHYIRAELNELAFFIRKDKAIPFGAAAPDTARLDASSLRFIGYSEAGYELYDDDGYSVSCNPEERIIFMKK